MRAAQRLMNAAREMRQSLIAEAITDYLGERCPEYVEGCFCCEAWAEFDRLTNTSSVPSCRTDSTSLAARGADESAATNSNQGEGNGLALPVGTATEKQAACSDRPDQSSSQVSSSQPAEPAGEVFLLQTSPATPLNPRPTTSRGSSLPDAQTASAGDTAASLSYSGGDA